MYYLFILLFSFCFTTKPITDDCKCDGIKLYGKVRFVTGSADFKIKFIESGSPDLWIQFVDRAYDCGEWEIVTMGEDFTVKIVDDYPDFDVRIADYSPGLR